MGVFHTDGIRLSWGRTALLVQLLLLSFCRYARACGHTGSRHEGWRWPSVVYSWTVHARTQLDSRFWQVQQSQSKLSHCPLTRLLSGEPALVWHCRCRCVALEMYSNLSPSMPSKMANGLRVTSPLSSFGLGHAGWACVVDLACHWVSFSNQA
jgi:hypothetical protein